MNKQANKSNYVSIKNITETSADIHFYGDIVSSDWYKWEGADRCPEDVLNVLEQAAGIPNLNIYVNSGGGSVFGGLAIYNMLKRHKAYKTVYIDALAGSIASTIIFAGDRVLIPSNGFVMVHKPLNTVTGNADELRKMADDLDRIEEGILNVYAENIREGVSMEQVKEMVQNETWLVGTEAAKIFNIEVIEANNTAACIGDSEKHYKSMPEALRKKPEQPNEPQNSVSDAQNGDSERLKLELELLSL